MHTYNRFIITYIDMIDTCIHTCLHACILAYVHTYIDKSMVLSPLEIDYMKWDQTDVSMFSLGDAQEFKMA